MMDALSQPFIDRREAGRLLAQQLRHYSYRSDALVLASHPGSVPIAYEVATVLGLRVDVFPNLSGGAIRDDQPARALCADTVILVDDGLSSARRMGSVVLAARGMSAARVVVAAPVGAADVCRALGTLADEVICARQPSRITATAEWYRHFPPLSDSDVQALLDRARQALAAMQP